MFNERVLIQRDLLSRSDILLFVELVSDLNTVLELYIEKIREKSNKKKKKSKKRKKKMTKEEEIELESAHTALLGLTILADSLALKHSEAFESVSKLIVEIIDTKADLFEMKMRCSAVLCFATLTRCLGPKMLPHLSRVVPRVLNNLENNQNVVLLRQASLKFLSALLRGVPQFLSPYVSRMVEVLTLGTNLDAVAAARSTKTPTGMHEMVLNLLARRVSDRKLFPILYRRFESALRTSTFAARTVLQILRCALKSCPRKNVSSNHQNIGRFLLNACERIASSDEIVTLREEIAKTYSDFVVRLNEVELRPIFHALCVWGSNSNVESSDDEEKRKRTDGDSYVSLRRRSVLVCVVSRLLRRLGEIFVPFVGNVWNVCAATLLIQRKSVAVSEEDQQRGKKRRKQTASQSQRIENSGISVLEDLQTQVLVLIRTTCRYDTTSTFVDAVRFKLMMPCLIAQLDASEYGNDKTEYINRTTKYVIPSIWQFACAAGTDVLWKPLNHRILLKTRSSNATTRWGALSAIQALYTHVGEDMLSLLPESIPFLAELLEDSDDTVHALCLEVKEMIEELSGEKLDSYLQ